jgi:hypothetical protein
MELTKRQKLEAAGWKVGNTAEFLQLSPAEIEIIEIRLSLSKSLKQLRQQKQGACDFLQRKFASLDFLLVLLALIGLSDFYFQKVTRTRRSSYHKQN